MQKNPKVVNDVLPNAAEIPLLSEKDLHALIKSIKNGDSEATKKFLYHNQRFVISVALHYQDKGLSLSELIEFGNQGLIKAAKRYDETRGYKFISYAVWWIRQSILIALENPSLRTDLD